MKNNIQALCVSTLAIILLWAGSTTLAQARLTEDQCFEMTSDAHAKTTARAGEIGFLVEQGHGLEYSKIWYSYHLATKVFYETECAHIDRIESYIHSSVLSMDQNGDRCAELGAGSNCGVTSMDMNIYKRTAGLSKNSNSNQTQSNSDTPTTKKLSAAEQKRQQAQQQADDLGTQSQQLAQENQAKADAARRGKRKKHDPAAEAHHCVQISTVGLFGNIKNTCPYKIEVNKCGYRPTKDSWLGSMTCEKQGFGAYGIGAGKIVTAHVKHVEKIYWFACKAPAEPVDTEFVEGQGIRARCKSW